MISAQHALRALLPALALMAPAIGADGERFLCARSADGDALVHLVVDRGLVVTRAPGAVELGDAHSPRFDAAGRLFFERSTDDGHHVIARELWVLDPGARVPRRPAPGELAPPWTAPAPPLAPPLDQGNAVRVCVDAGHGGSDPGASGFGYLEKDMNLDMALRLRDLLVADTQDPAGGGEWEVVMTRTSDVTTSLAARVQIANSWPADRFVSIHCNAFGSPAANGTETYAFAEGTTAAAMRDRIHAQMLAAWGLTDRGTKTANFYVLVNTTMPASLSETGFISSPIDIQRISDPASRQEMALAHLFALQEHYGIAPYEPGSQAPINYCSPKISSTGCVPFMTWSGTATLTGPDDFHVRAQGVLANQFGIFLWSLSPASVPLGGGTRCVGLPIVRTPVQQSGGVGCLGTYDYLFSQATMTQQGLGVGTVVYGQYWFRDPGFASPNNIGLTDGLAFFIRP